MKCFQKIRWKHKKKKKPITLYWRNFIFTVDTEEERHEVKNLLYFRRRFSELYKYPFTPLGSLAIVYSENSSDTLMNRSSSPESI